MTRALVADIVDASFVDGPGNRYVVFLQGCTFNCLTCHNPHTIACRQTDESRWIDIHEDDFDEAQLAAWIRQAAASPGWVS